MVKYNLELELLNKIFPQGTIKIRNLDYPVPVSSGDKIVVGNTEKMGFKLDLDVGRIEHYESSSNMNPIIYSRYSLPSELDPEGFMDLMRKHYTVLEK